MYCPKCSQPQVSDEMQFCSRCGLALSNLKEMILADGKTEANPSEASDNKLTARQKGIRQGVMLMLLSVILIPAQILLAALFPANDILVESSVSDTPFEKISQAVLFTIFMFGVARVLYACLFQQGAQVEEREAGVAQLDNSTSNYALPPAQSIPISDFGAWRANTGEIARSQSNTKHTTKSLE